ncbi:MAG: DUF4147 domain-containing protein, partial [Clostridia bacterium]|nr:DUF4147 domain-containing protein [Clostridia bacterium]
MKNDLHVRQLRQDALDICKTAIGDAVPNVAVARAIDGYSFLPGKVVVIAIGKAAWPMAKQASLSLGERLTKGLVVTKYHHSGGEIPNFRIIQAGHPIPDQNSCLGAKIALEYVADLTENDQVLFLISGGGSSLFELPLVPLPALMDITDQLLKAGADIREMNTIRKRLSGVKGGKFAQRCGNATVFSIVLSDVLGDSADMIASGPTAIDSSTCEDALDIVRRYHIALSDEAKKFVQTETPKVLKNSHIQIVGGVSQLCARAKERAKELGYHPFILTTWLSCEAREAGKFLAAMAKEYALKGEKLAFIAGGETMVHVTGTGMGGRNQEMALAAAPIISGLANIVMISLGSDGTDGPTDAAGGMVDGTTADTLTSKGISVYDVLQNNDAYHGLKQCDG